MASDTPAEHLRKLWKLLAFAARYGHADPRVMRHMPVPEVTAFVNALGEILMEEKDAMAAAAAGND